VGRNGIADSRRGIREFVAGTGGADLVRFSRSIPNIEFFISAFGVLKLTLRQGAYDRQFVVAGGGISDSGSDVCR
jgi:acid phosphatase type 7